MRFVALLSKATLKKMLSLFDLRERNCRGRSVFDCQRRHCEAGADTSSEAYDPAMDDVRKHPGSRVDAAAIAPARLL